MGLFFIGFFQNNASMVEEIFKMTNSNVQVFLDAIQKGFMYLINLSEVKEDQLFKLCIEFWNQYIKKLVSSQGSRKFFN